MLVGSYAHCGNECLHCKSNLTLDDWHERLGHVSKDTLVKFGTNAIEDFDIKACDHSNDDNHQCESCAYGKQYRAPFKSISKSRSKPLERVDSDLCESNVVSMGGGKIVLTFTDNATLYGRVMILPNKNASTVLAAFKDYQAWAERQSGHKIKELRTDRGAEYMGEMMYYKTTNLFDSTLMTSLSRSLTNIQWTFG